MKIIIKKTGTVEEYKKKKDFMSDLAEICCQEHKRESEPLKAWFNSYEDFCIEYADEEIFCYRYNPIGKLEWKEIGESWHIKPSFCF